VQVGTVAEAVEVAKTSRPDVLVLQGSDAGGHGLDARASIITLVPEVSDALRREGIQIPLIAAGGISDGRGAAAALTLGAAGVALGTRFLASEEAQIAKGYQHEILRVGDGGVSTVQSKVYDAARGIYGWPAAYGGRGVANRTYLDALQGMSDEENQAFYKEAVEMGDQGWGPEGRMTTYAGTGVGLISHVLPAGDIVRHMREEAVLVLEAMAGRYRG
jgi:nitronate monooxygenase